MPAMRDHVQAYVERPQKQRLQREAAARGVSVSQCVTDCLREYFAWREEMSAAIDNPGQPGEAHGGGPIQVLLTRTESRLVATLDARIRNLVGDLVLLQSMIDRQAVTYFLHTPEVAPELQTAALWPAQRGDIGTGGGRSSASSARGASTARLPHS